MCKINEQTKKSQNANLFLKKIKFVYFQYYTIFLNTVNINNFILITR